MKKILFTSISLILFNCHLSTNDCNKFREGKFKTFDPTSGTTFITRKGDIQTEINNDIGYSVKLKIKWENDCKYTLRLLEVLENKPMLVFDSTLIMTVQITEVKDNSYLQTTTSNKFNTEYKSEIFKLE